MLTVTSSLMTERERWDNNHTTFVVLLGLSTMSGRIILRSRSFHAARTVGVAVSRVEQEELVALRPQERRLHHGTLPCLHS